MKSEQQIADRLQETGDEIANLKDKCEKLNKEDVQDIQKKIKYTQRIFILKCIQDTLMWVVQ